MGLLNGAAKEGKAMRRLLETNLDPESDSDTEAPVDDDIIVIDSDSDD